MATLDIITRMKNEAKRELQDLDDSLQGVGKSSKGASGEASGLRNSFANLQGTLVATGAALGTVTVVVSQTYDALKEGAALELAESRFSNLAESIDTTAESLLGKLRTATKGMQTDAELIAGATDIINLGLGKTEDDVTRLATVIGGLGLDMQQVILTFANNSTMRLDALGLSVEGVTKKAKELEDQGFVGDAFDEAVLISLEEKMVLLGDASETTAGQIQILETAYANAKSEATSFVAGGLAPWVRLLSGDYKKAINDSKEALAENVEGVDEYIAAVREAMPLSYITKSDIDIAREYNEILEEQAYYRNLLSDTDQEYITTLDDVTDEYVAAAIAAGKYNTALVLSGAILPVVEEKTDNTAEANRLMGLSLIDAKRAQDAYAARLEGLAALYPEVIAVTEDMGDASAELTEELARQQAAWGDMFTRIDPTTTSIDRFGREIESLKSPTDDFGQSIYNALDNAGASPGVLAIAGSSFGVFSEEVAAAKLSLLLFEMGLEQMAEAAMADGEITQEELAEIYTKAQDLATTIESMPDSFFIQGDISVTGLDQLREAEERASRMAAQAVGAYQSERPVMDGDGSQATAPPNPPSESTNAPQSSIPATPIPQFGPSFGGGIGASSPQGFSPASDDAGGDTYNFYIYSNSTEDLKQAIEDILSERARSFSAARRVGGR